MELKARDHETYLNIIDDLFIKGVDIWALEYDDVMMIAKQEQKDKLWQNAKQISGKKLLIIS